MILRHEPTPGFTPAASGRATRVSGPGTQANGRNPALAAIDSGRTPTGSYSTTDGSWPFRGVLRLSLFPQPQVSSARDDAARVIAPRITVVGTVFPGSR